MNAYKLADELNIHIKRGNDYEFLKETVTMLRQQANLIAELEKAVKDALEIGIAEGFVKAHKQSAEPVAWMDKRTNKCVVFINTPPSDNWIPLYTTPQQQLIKEKNT